MNKLLQSGALACVLVALMAGGQSAATSPTGAHSAPADIEALLAVYDDVQVRRAQPVALAPVRQVTKGSFTLVTGTDVRAVIEGVPQ